MRKASLQSLQRRPRTRPLLVRLLETGRPDTIRIHRQETQAAKGQSMTTPTIPKGYDAVKVGKDVIGCVSRQRVNMFGQYEGKDISSEGHWQTRCHTNSRGSAIDCI